MPADWDTVIALERRVIDVEEELEAVRERLEILENDATERRFGFHVEDE